MIIGEGKHTFPSRTRSLSPQPPMVVPPRCGARVGRCQYYEALVSKEASASLVFRVAYLWEFLGRCQITEVAKGKLRGSIICEANYPEGARLRAFFAKQKSNAASATPQVAEGKLRGSIIWEANYPAGATTARILRSKTKRGSAIMGRGLGKTSPRLSASIYSAKVATYSNRKPLRRCQITEDCKKNA